ncbi:MAG: RNA polymerase sigma factor [Planctomycetes bacterium]|nr:RNA polymerase sigma factor [Planctomycetota bacterium]
MSESGPDSQHLVAAAHRGDRDALDALLRRHLADLRVFVRAKSGPVLREQESCSDLVQTVCREALQSLDQYEWRGEGSFRRWLFTLAMNKLRNRADFHAAERRDAARVVGADSVLGGVAAGFAPSQHAIGNEAAARFEVCLDRLDPDQRDVILMARVVGMEHREIATELGIAEGAVRTRLSRALARLATLMSAS